MRTNTKRFFAALLSVIMILSMLPINIISAYAADSNQVRVIVENTTYTDDSAPWSGTLVDKFVDLKPDSTMMSCVVDALGSYSQQGAESNYISEINGLSAFDGGSMSGWMGTLNDWFTNEGFGAFTVAKGTLSAGDEIRIMYTMNYGADLGGSWGNTDKTLKDLAFSAGTLSDSFNGSVHTYTLFIPSGVNSLYVTPTANNKNYQVRTYVDGEEYKRTKAVPVSDGTVITVKCGDPSWPSMNGNSGEAEVYTVEVKAESDTPKLILSLKNPVVAAGVTNELVAKDQDGNFVTCKWEISDESLFGKKTSNGSYLSLRASATAENVTISATSVDDPTFTATITFDVVPMAEIYAVVNGKAEQKLEVKNFARSYWGVEVPSYAESVMLRPADGSNLTAGSSDWTSTFDENGFCNISMTVGSMPETAYIPEKLAFNREILPNYPADKWQSSRIEVGNSGTFWIFWEVSDAKNNDVKAENASFYTPISQSGSNFQMLLNRGVSEAAFLFRGDAVKAYFSDSEFKIKGDEIPRRDDGYFAMPICADDLSGTQNDIPQKQYYIIAENENAPATKMMITVYQRNEEFDTPTAVDDYLCLASQYTNNSNSAFGNYGVMPERTLIGKTQAGTGELISLGNFGGYIVYRFDDLIYNDPKNPYGTDFVINGNTMGGAGFSEPGNVLVSQDGETWYTLAGSDHYNNNALWNYTITYTSNDKLKAEWTDSTGASGISYNFPSEDGYPLFNWTEDNKNSITVSGTLLVAEGTDPYGSRTAAFPNWGYVDTGYKGLNPYIGGQAGEVFDLSWAVDENGQPVNLDWVKYVKVQTASNVDGGSIGEKSTEISAIYKTVASQNSVGLTDAPFSIAVNGRNIELKNGLNVYYAVSEEAVDVSVDVPESTNVYINSTYGNEAHFDSLAHRMVRVIVQEGEKEPEIYYINLRTHEEQAGIDKAIAENVIEKIDAIGNIVLSSVNAIEDARTAYNALTKEQQVFVTNYSVLLDAENKYANLIAAFNRKIEDIYQSVGDYISSLGTPSVGSVGGEWMVIGLKRADRDISDGYYSYVLEYVASHINDKEQLHRVKSTDNSRIILALTAMGYDVTNVSGHNLLVGLTDLDYVKAQGINGPIWALIAFDSHNYVIPDGNVTREALIESILDGQFEDGGWSVWDTSDPDMTAMAIQALAPYYNKNKAVKNAVDKALFWLSAVQNTNGGFGSVDGASSESSAQVITALTALGINPHTDERFIKNGHSVINALCEYYTDGGFRHTIDGELNGMATEQGYYALAAYFRFLNGKTCLYDMSDVIIRTDINSEPSDDPAENPKDDNNSDATTPSDNNQGGENVTSKPIGNENVNIPNTEYNFTEVVYTGFIMLLLAVFSATVICKRIIK